MEPSDGCICCILREDLLDTFGRSQRFDTTVSVVGAAGFLAELLRGDLLAERGIEATADDERSIAHRCADH